VSVHVAQPGGVTLSTKSAEDVLKAMQAARVWDVSDAATKSGVSLAHISQDSLVLVVFLRHFGCTFCREAMTDLSKSRQEIQNRGVRIVVVHMVTPEAARPHLARYGLTAMNGVGHISDPEKKLYLAFELMRGKFKQLFGLRVIWRGFVAGAFGGHWVGRLAGDGFQMPGAFLVKRGQILRAYRHQDAAERPDYCEIAGV
jgi:peroxiredoxin